MVRLVAFLRGINVGSHLLRKEALIDLFIAVGFTNVVTYKQSGNVIFETNLTNPHEVTDNIESSLKAALGYEVCTFLRTLPYLQRILEYNPFKNQQQAGASFLVTFLASAPPVFPLPLPVVIPKSTAQILAARGLEVFSVTHGGGEGALSNPFIEATLKVKATTRNLNIIRDLVEKYR